MSDNSKKDESEYMDLCILLQDSYILLEVKFACYGL